MLPLQNWKRRGMGLLVVMGACSILALFTGAMLLTTTRTMAAVNDGEKTDKARYAAYSGIQTALARLNTPGESGWSHQLQPDKGGAVPPLAEPIPADYEDLILVTFAGDPDVSAVVGVFNNSAACPAAYRSAATPDGTPIRDFVHVLDLADAPALPGSHNAQNAAAAAAACRALGLARGEIAGGLVTFGGLPHRLERVAEARGVAFVNDSKATNADSAARALASYDRVVWIAGGEAKEGGIESLVPFFPRIARAFLIGRDAPVLARTLASHGVPHEVAGTLDAAVPAAAAAAFGGAAPVVLLSPACASWDQFSGFDARGERFRDLARALAAPDGRAA